jgi:hypothetical protein
MKQCILLIIACLSFFGVSYAYDLKQGFVENRGQWMTSDREVYFENHDHQVSFRITSLGLEYEWAKPNGASLDLNRVYLEPLGGKLGAFQKMEAVNDNFYYTSGREVVAKAYKKIVLKDLYPLIDWVIYDTECGIKYDFIVHPGGDPRDIQLNWRNAEGVKITGDGGMTVDGKLGKISDKAPIAFQGDQKVWVQYVLKGKRFGFDLGDFDPKQDLIIDPEVIWSSYYGGEVFDDITGITSDVDNNIYITGTTTSTTVISGNAVGGNIHQANMNGSRDAFIAKFNAQGQRLWATYYGGEGQDEGNTIAIDQNGFVYMGGTTTSTMLVASFGFQPTLSGIRDGFIVKFNGNGQRVWGSYLGGSGSEYVLGITVDNEGRVLVLGETTSSDYPVFGGGDNVYGGQGDVFITCINGMASLYWSTFFGGENIETAGGIGYDALNDRIYITGSTASVTGIASSGQQTTYGGGLKDGYIAAFNELGVMSWATYVGGVGTDIAEQCSSDIYGNIYLVGTTSSNGFATVGAFQPSFAGGVSDAFMAKYSSTGILNWRSYFGGPGADVGSSMVADAVGNIYFGGQTNSAGLAINGFQTSVQGGTDLFLTKFTVEGTPQWATYYGGAGNEELRFLSIDPMQKILFAGSAASPLLASNGWQSTLNGGQDGIFGRIEDCPNPYVTIAIDGELEFCEGEIVTMAAGGADSYVWSTGDTTEFIEVEETQWITVRGLMDGCQGISAPLYVDAKPLPEVSIFFVGETVYCTPDIYLELFPTVTPDSLVAFWEWTHDNSQSDPLIVTEEGSYSVSVMAINECEASSGVSISLAETPDVVMALATDSICVSAQPLNLVGLPLGGTFVSDGGGIQGSTFNPGLAGGGAHYIHYEINDPVSGCTVSTPEEFIDVLFAPTELFLPTDTICFNGFPVLMTGVPAGGFYTGIGVSGNQFYPNIAGSGWHAITYNYVDPQGCTNRAVRNIYVDPCGVGVEETELFHWTIYPNPAQGVLYVQSDFSQKCTFRIVNGLGQIVHVGQLGVFNTLSIDDLASGIYTFVVETEEHNIQARHFEKQ